MRIALGCQGGGSHTAFTAGVLARLVEAGAFDGHEVVGISGTSGGAINALLTWSVLRAGRLDRAPEVLDAFWDDNSARTPPERLLNAFMVGAGVAQSLGLAPPLNPYLVPPALDGREMFRALLRRHVDFDAFDVDRAGTEPLLVLGAVDVLDGSFRAFSSRRDRITPDTVLASAAIPTLFRAIEVEGGRYWDGLFSQNPPVAPLLSTRPDELWVLQINPGRRPDEPRTTLDIADRRNELAGNLSLNQELAAIETVDRLLERGVLEPGAGYRQVTVRVLEMPRPPATGLLGSASKLNRDAAFLAGLRREGREQADRFLAALSFERAWVDGDRAALRSLLTGTRVESDVPGVRTVDDLVTRMVDDLRRDVTRKQVAGGTVVWRVRLTAGDGTARAATATVTFDGARVTGLRLAPLPDDDGVSAR